MVAGNTPKALTAAQARQADAALQRLRDGDLTGALAAAGRLVAEAHGRFLGASPTQKAALKQRYGMPASASLGGGE